MGRIGWGGRDHIARSGRWKEAGWRGKGTHHKEREMEGGGWAGMGERNRWSEGKGEGRHCKEPGGGRRVEWDRVRVDREGMKWKEAEREEAWGGVEFSGDELGGTDGQRGMEWTQTERKGALGRTGGGWGADGVGGGGRTERNGGSVSAA